MGLASRTFVFHKFDEVTNRIEMDLDGCILNSEYNTQLVFSGPVGFLCQCLL